MKLKFINANDMNGNKVYLEPSMIINAVANHFKLSPGDVICTKRTREFIKAKHIAMYCFKQFTDFSLTRIGMEFNGKDHATVIYAIHSVENQSDIYKTYKTELSAILYELNLQSENEFNKYKNYDTEAT